MGKICTQDTDKEEGNLVSGYIKIEMNAQLPKCCYIKLKGLYYL